MVYYAIPVTMVAVRLVLARMVKEAQFLASVNIVLLALGFLPPLRPVSDVLTTRGNLCNHGLLWVRTNLVPHGFPGPLRSLVVL